ncbi:MAG: hypothetical protein MUO31_07920 [Thermodesulfovibrionales bacterium]|nr:hypothetical protein [Thermodesulfovibrionales bacterium]
MESIESIAGYSKGNYGFMCAFLHLKWKPANWTAFVIYAVQYGEKDALSYYLAHHPSVSFYISQTLAELGQLWALELIFERFGCLPYHVSKYAARNGHLECLRFLLNAVHVDPNGKDGLLNGNYLHFKDRFEMPHETYADKCALMNYGNRHDAAYAAIKGGELECFKICNVYTAELAAASAGYAISSIFMIILNKLEKTRHEIVKISKTISADTDCMKIFCDVIGPAHYVWAHIKRIEIMCDNSYSVACLADMGVKFVQNDCMEAIRFDAFNSLPVLLAHTNPSAKRRHAYAVFAAQDNSRECIEILGIYNNTISLALIHNQRWFKHVLSKYDPYTTPVGDTPVKELEHLVSKSAGLLMMWHKSTGRFPPEAAYDACSENDLCRLVYILDNNGVVKFSAVQRAAYVGAYDCLKLLLLRPSMTTAHKRKCAKIAIENGHLDCVEVCGLELTEK